jgi:phospholipid transport system substrate-binding protein
MRNRDCGKSLQLIYTAPTRAAALSLLLVLAAPPLTAAAAEVPAAAAAEVPAAATGVIDTDPGLLIESAAQEMLRDLDAHRADYRKDPHKVNTLVDRILLPHFDTEYSARLVLGRHWNSASPEQRQRFVNSFYHSLLNSYGTALLEFTDDRLKVLPYKGDPAATSATVRTQVRKSDGGVVAVNYSLHRTAKGWMAWDVIIEGISYVKSFRDDFGAEIEQNGVESLIARLEKRGSAK